MAPIKKSPALYHPSWQCRIDVVRDLLHDGADPNERGAGGRSALLALARVTPQHAPEKLEVAALLLDGGADIDAGDDEGASALMWAVDSKHTELVKFLLERGADVNHAGKFGRTAWDVAVEKDAPSEIREMLRAAGAAGSPATHPILEAARAADIDAVRQALDGGAPPDTANRDGITALHLACAAGQATLATLLLDHGANPNPADLQGITALDEAARTGSAPLCKLLTDRGAPVDGASDITPLMRAANAGHAEAVQTLLAAGANPKAKDSINRTAFKYARSNRHKAVVAILQGGGTGEDPAFVFATGFATAAESPAFRAEVDRLTAVLGKKPATWKRKKGVFAFAPSIKTWLAMADERFGPASPKQGESKEEFQRDRAIRAAQALQDEVRATGFHLVLNDPSQPKPIVLFPVAEKYAVLAACGTNGDNYGHDTPEVIAWLRELEKETPFLLTGCGHDFVSGRFEPPVASAATLGERLAEFCPDLIDGDEIESAEALAAEIQKEQELFLWWD